MKKLADAMVVARADQEDLRDTMHRVEAGVLR
jgi:hypothetical protein